MAEEKIRKWQKEDEGVFDEGGHVRVGGPAIADGTDCAMLLYLASDQGAWA